MSAMSTDGGGTALVVYSWPRLWSLGEGRGSPDFHHSLTAMTRAFRTVVLVYPDRGDSPLPEQAPPGIEAHGFRPAALPLIESPAGPVWLRRLVFAANWPLRLANYARFNRAARKAALRAIGDRQTSLVDAHGFMGVPAAAGLAREFDSPLAVRLFGVGLGMRGLGRLMRIAQFEEARALRAPATGWVITDDGSGGSETARGLGAPEHRVHALRAAVDRDWRDAGGGGVDRREYRRRLGLPENCRIVLRVCRLWVQQHVERMIEALPVETPGGSAVAAVIIGDGPEREKLERLAILKGKPAKFLGAVDHDRLAEHYLAADIYAATADRTNLGQSVLEAICCGLPVAAVDVGETSDLVRDGETGRLVPPGDGAALARAVAELLSDDDTRARMSAGARRLAEDEIPDVESRIAAEEEIYRGMTQSPERGN